MFSIKDYFLVELSLESSFEVGYSRSNSPYNWKFDGKQIFIFRVIDMRVKFKNVINKGTRLHQVHCTWQLHWMMIKFRCETRSIYYKVFNQSYQQLHFVTLFNSYNFALHRYSLCYHNRLFSFLFWKGGEEFFVFLLISLNTKTISF